ncbi:acetyl-CoA hydrolase/transferase family protein [Chachezhania sediminis]|uniref:acetyl-CoA hydrolase/transferase family protein n=1 Tax=Chachezhania sediminis TaxID=2599291 RepID=UPI00131D3A1C|nr:acetyl-CoA hydrolase/transferase C-terminal domain-containing protein [Chachezhania sediminis]
MPRVVEPGALDLSGLILPDETICWGQASAEPLTLTRALMAQRHALGGVEAFVGVSWNDTVDPSHADAIRFRSYCGAGRTRSLHGAGKLDILPVHYSDFGRYLTPRIDVLFLQLGPGRRNGTYSFGLACEYLWPLVRSARLVIAEVNDRAPSTPGLVQIDEADIDIVVPSSVEIPVPPAAEVTDQHRAMARIIADQVPDGATLQVGLGAIPAAILDALEGHRALGIHTGLYVDGFTRLIQAGAVDNSRKGMDAGYSVAGLITGTADTLRMCRDTDLIRLAPTSHTHALDHLARLNAFVSVNSAIEVDLTGQTNAEVAGSSYVGAVGGGPDFARGAAMSPGGLPICALPAARQTRGGGLISSIVPALSGPVSLSRADAGIIVTEFGMADLRGRTLRERVRAMVDIAHPDLREDLARQAHDLGLATD